MSILLDLQKAKQRYYNDYRMFPDKINITTETFKSLKIEAKHQLGATFGPKQKEFSINGCAITIDDSLDKPFVLSGGQSIWHDED